MLRVLDLALGLWGEIWWMRSVKWDLEMGSDGIQRDPRISMGSRDR